MWIKQPSHAIFASRKNVVCLSWAEFVVVRFAFVDLAGRLVS